MVRISLGTTAPGRESAFIRVLFGGCLQRGDGVDAGIRDHLGGGERGGATAVVFTAHGRPPLPAEPVIRQAARD